MRLRKIITFATSMAVLSSVLAMGGCSDKESGTFYRYFGL